MTMGTLSLLGDKLNVKDSVSVTKAQKRKRMVLVVVGEIAT